MNELNPGGVQVPTLGRIVLYRSRTGLYTVPATVSATKKSLHQPNVDAGLIPGLSSESHVHLHVMTPGTPGKRAEAADFVVESEHPRQENVGGAYTEWDIPFGGEIASHDDYDSQQPGTWVYPPRV